MPKEPKPLYLGLFLDTEDVEELWPSLTGTPLYTKVVCNHTTLKFRPSPEEVAAFKVGRLKMLCVKGWAANATNQVFVVGRVDGFPCDNAHPHITVALNDGGKPKDSNTLLEAAGGEYTRFEKDVWVPVVSGIHYDKGQLVTTLPRSN